MKLESSESQSHRARFAPYLSTDSGRNLLGAFKKLQEELIAPDSKDCNNSKKLAAWKALSPAQADWAFLDDYDTTSLTIGAEGAQNRRWILKVELIGPPNVGKSSLLNALIGPKMVCASRNTGKTTFQTYRVGNTRLQACYCLGFVFPS